ncbi:MAG: nuclear pore complex subunit [Bacteroidetes bacterium CG02_land_8_20_14_3_00_31_25]|nr:DUF1987 domain-containing protein [Bacteroidota bacterium]PIV63156.1 MAG: nuclear pore complex subunit [Bacteroidetes bacterium CG02_land_8_20_14_3_00_31_25]PIX34412.1 MAG: nuclear pore complex subunit [Bacteroidetes bacterium CG_4_8_14_3_um_filter_31_14]PIY07362.1 MAG: nuclear pore complex subunit [Bacteroidetes bacterium CG_4_10_14_3_um_filter_31_20]
MPEKLIIDSTEDTPKVIFDAENKIFQISERSLPENAIGFYDSLLNWLTQYSKNPIELTIFDFKLEYFNTASAKQIAKILLILENIGKKKNVVINWYFKKEDADMLSSGTRFSKLINLNFNFAEY